MMQSASNLLEKINDNSVQQITLSKEMCSASVMIGDINAPSEISQLLACSYIAATPDNKLIGARNNGGRVSIIIYDVVTNHVTLHELSSTKNYSLAQFILSQDGKCLVIANPGTSELIAIDFNNFTEEVIHKSPMYSGADVIMKFNQGFLVTVAKKIDTADLRNPGGLLKWYKYNHDEKLNKPKFGFDHFAWGRKVDHIELSSFPYTVECDGHHIYTSTQSGIDKISLDFNSPGVTTFNPVSTWYSGPFLNYLTWKYDTDGRASHLYCLSDRGNRLNLAWFHKDISPTHLPEGYPVNVNGELIKKVTPLFRDLIYERGLILVQTNIGMHLYHYNNKKDLGLIESDSNILIALPDQRVAFQDHQALGIAAFYESPSFQSSMTALMANTSVTKVSIRDINLTNDEYEALWQLKQTRPDIQFKLGPEINERIAMKEQLFQQDQEILLLKEHKTREETIMHARISALEDLLKEYKEATQRELQNLKEECIQTQRETENLKISLKESQDKTHQMTRLIRAGARTHSAPSTVNSPIPPIALEVRESSELSDALLEKLMNGTTVIDVNLMKLSEQLPDDVRESLKARGAILSMQDLFSAVKQMNANSDKDKLQRLIFALEGLAQEKSFLSENNKKVLHGEIINQLLAEKANKLNNYLDIKQKYVTLIRKTFDDPDLNPDKVLIPFKILKDTLFLIFEQHPETINTCVTDFITNLIDHLKQCSDPNAAQIAELKQEIAALKHKQEDSNAGLLAGSGLSLFSDGASGSLASTSKKEIVLHKIAKS